MEPTEILSKFYPDSGVIQSRAVEGFFLLQYLPFVGAAHQYMLPALELASDCITVLDALKSKIMSHSAFISGEPARAEWIGWFNDVTPSTLLVADYIQSHTYTSPLRVFFLENREASHTHWSDPLAVARDEITRFTSRIGIALPTVISTLTPFVPLRPYALVEGGHQADLALAASLQRYIDNGSEASQRLRLTSKSNKAQLVAVIQKRLKQNGHHHATSAKNKPELVDMIIELNRDFIIGRFNSLEHDETTLIHNYINNPAQIRGLDHVNVVEVAGTPVSLDSFQTLADSRRSLSPAMMDAMMSLSRDRDAELFDLHKQTNEKDRYYKPRDLTTYMSATHSEVGCKIGDLFIGYYLKYSYYSHQAILTAQGDLRVELLPNDFFTSTGTCFMPYRQPYVGSSLPSPTKSLAWMYLEIDIRNGKVTFHRPKLVDPLLAADPTVVQKQISDEATQDKQVLARLLGTLDAKRTSVGDASCPEFVQQRQDTGNFWKFDALHSRPQLPVWATADATAAISLTWGRCFDLQDFGIAVLVGMEFGYASISLAWDATDIPNILRPNFSFWLLKNELPMF